MSFFRVASGKLLISMVFTFGLTCGVTWAKDVASTGDDAYDRGLGWQDVRDTNREFFTESDRNVVRMSLQDCIARALEHNLDIKIAVHDPAIRMADVVKAEAAFDAVLFGTAEFENTDQANIESGFYTRTIETGSGASQVRMPTDGFTRSHDHQYALGLRKRLPTGATIELAQRLRRFRTDETDLFRNPFYEYSFDLELRQPLLRDFGIDLNRAAIDASRNTYEISRQQFRLLVIQTAVEVESNFWQLIFARQQVNILQNLLRQSESTLARLEERTILDAGSGMIARNRGQIERSRADLVAALSEVRSRQDRLLESINDPNIPLDGFWEIVPTDRPSTHLFKAERAEVMEIALRTRPELISQQLQLDTSDIALGVAENQLLPRLDLIARQEATGPGDSYHSAWRTQQHYDTINYLLGLSFEIPIGNRAAQASLVRARRERQQDQLRLTNYRQQITADVSIAMNTLEGGFQEIDERKRASLAQTDELRAYLVQEATEAKVDANFLNRKLDAQDRLARAHIQTAQTILRYNLAIMDLQRAQGTLLQYNNIMLEELAP